MSAPAAKAFSVPVSTIAPIAGSASKARSASASSSINWSQSAFNACGRLSRIKPTAPRVSVTIICGAAGVCAEFGAMGVFLPFSVVSALYLRAIKGTSGGLDQPANASASRRPRATGAGFARVAIDLPGMLEVTKRAVRLHIVAQARTPGGNCFGQRCFDGRNQPFGTRTAHRSCPPSGAEFGPIERFARINIAKPGNESLIHQRGFEAHGPPVQRLFEIFWRKRILQRLGA